MLVLPLAGSVVGRVRGRAARAGRRAGVFAGPTDFAYLPPAPTATLISADGRPVRAAVGAHRAAAAGALRPGRRRAGRAARRRRRARARSTTSARRRRSTPTALIAVRGAHARRQLVVVPAAQARRGDRAGGVEAELEEIYYFEVATAAGRHRPTSGSTAPPDRPIDVLAEVRTGDVVLIPHGWHGPSMAAPGYDLYYLNVMAGPGDERAWLICDDPAHAWVRDTWAGPGRRPAAAVRRPPEATPMTRPCGSPSAQALVRFLAAQYTERDGVEQRLIAGCFGIFGHGNVAGVGQALLEAELDRTAADLPYYQARNEQGMVHAAVGYARHAQPAADAGVHRLDRPGRDQHGHRRGAGDDQPAPVLLLPGDIFATRVAEPGAAGARGPARRRRLGQRRVPAGLAVLRPGQPARAAAPRAARRDAGADRPGRDRRGHASRCRRTCRPRRTTGRTSCSRARVWHVAPAACPSRRARPGGRGDPRAPRRPLIVAGGGVIYSEADGALRAFAEATGIPVARDPGRQGLAAATTTRCRVGGVGRDRHDGGQRRWPARPTW